MRKIIHIDMDAFFAAIEQRDFPELQGRAIAVGGSGNRGVVATASYEARKFGVRSAMPSVLAKRKCPQLIFVPARFQVYKEVSRQIRTVFQEYTDLIEPLSLDEAYLDVTDNFKKIAYALDVAKEIQRRIWEETRLTSSAGVSFNKFLAKIASDQNKPNGICVIGQKRAKQFLAELPIERFFGIGEKTTQKMHEMGIFNGQDLKMKSKQFLIENFGKSGENYHDFARGIDHRPVNSNRQRKSIGVEWTFKMNTDSIDRLHRELATLAKELSQRIQKAHFQGKTLTLKVKYEDFTIQSKSITESRFLDKEEEILNISMQLFSQLKLHKQIRLVGLSLKNNEMSDFKQLNKQLEFIF